MFQTEDHYELSFKGEVQNLVDKYKIFDELELQDKFPLDNFQELLEEGQTTIYSTYKDYKVFIFYLYQIIESFSLKIVFNPVENEENLTTEVKCEIDENSEVNFSLLNIWLDDLNSVYEDEIDYEDMEKDEFGSSMFEKDKKISFNCKNLNLEDFLQEFSHD